METEILTIITVIVTFIMGLIAKKVKWINNNLIPVQNLAIGVIFAIVEWIITGDFNMALTVSGLFAGGVYDLGHNFKKMFPQLFTKKK